MAVSLATAMVATIAISVAILLVTTLVALLLNNGTLQTVARSTSSGLRALQSVVETLCSHMIRAGARVADLMQQALRGAAGQVDQIGNCVNRLLGLLRKGMEQQVRVGFDIMAKRLALFAEDVKVFLTQQVGALASRATQIALGVFSELFSLVGGAVTAGIGFAEQAVTDGVEFLQDIWSTVQTFFQNLLDSTIGWVLGLLADIGQFIEDVRDWVINTANVVVGALLDAANTIWDAVRFPFCLYCDLCAWLPFCSRPSPCFSYC
jgi:phage-related protein